MKRNEVMALIATTILMFAVCLSASAKGKRNVERGMTKQEVIAILGEPKLTCFDMYGDKWEYAKYNNLFGDSKYITIFFDRNGKVVQYDTRIIEPNSQTSNVQQPHPTPPLYDGRCDPDGRMDYGYCLDDASFSKLYNKVKKASFDDNKFDLIEVARPFTTTFRSLLITLSSPDLIQNPSMMMPMVKITACLIPELMFIISPPLLSC